MLPSPPHGGEYGRGAIACGEAQPARLINRRPSPAEPTSLCQCTGYTQRPRRSITAWRSDHTFCRASRV